MPAQLQICVTHRLAIFASYVRSTAGPHRLQQLAAPREQVGPAAGMDGLQARHRRRYQQQQHAVALENHCLFDVGVSEWLRINAGDRGQASRPHDCAAGYVHNHRQTSGQRAQVTCERCSDIAPQARRVAGPPQGFKQANRLERSWDPALGTALSHSRRWKPQQHDRAQLGAACCLVEAPSSASG
jgi:hypothetical protein